MQILLSGKQVAKKLNEEARRKVIEFTNAGKPAPQIAVVQVGEDPASTVYVKNKLKTAEKIGIRSRHEHLPESITEEELIGKVASLNEDEDVDAILVQLPLPGRISERRVISTISVHKDVDCLHPENIGRLWCGDAYVTPCTPQGIIHLLKHYGIALEGKRVVIIGRSIIVGKPLAALMLQNNATVTICHSRTKDLASIARKADILVSAVGRARMVKEDFVAEGAVVVDVGISRLIEDCKQKLVGDVDFEAVSKKVYALSPVPGGVGPMTIASLMQNVIKCYQLNRGMVAL